MTAANTGLASPDVLLPAGHSSATGFVVGASLGTLAPLAGSLARMPLREVPTRLGQLLSCPHVGASGRESLGATFGRVVEREQARRDLCVMGFTGWRLPPLFQRWNGKPATLSHVAAHMCQPDVRWFIDPALTSRDGISVSGWRPSGVVARSAGLKEASSVGADADRHRAFKCRDKTSARSLDQSMPRAEGGEIVDQHRSLGSPAPRLWRDAGHENAAPQQPSSAVYVAQQAVV